MKPNVLLVVLDTVRARNMGLYGYPRETTPFLDSFVPKNATCYEQARAPASRSLDSHVSLFTGLAVEEHGVTTVEDKLAPEHSVFHKLRGDGYRTGVFTENSWLTDVDAGLRDGFDTIEGPRNVPFPDALDPTAFVADHGKGAYREYLSTAAESDRPLQALLNGVAVKLGSDYPSIFPGTATSTPGETYTDLFLDWSADIDGPWAACVNYMDAHHPYEPRPEFDQWGDTRLRSLQEEIGDVKWEFNGGQRQWWQRAALESLYDGAIRQLDAELKRLISALVNRGELDNTLLVILSDHGEGFGEHSHIRPGVRVASHSVGVHEVLTHVPLIVKAPEQEMGARVSEVCSIAEFPDVVEAALDGDVATDEFVSDAPVMATANGLDQPVQERARAYCEDLHDFTAPSRAVWSGSGTEVTKAITWRDHVSKRVCRDAQTNYAVDIDGTRTEVEAVFKAIEEFEVTVANRGLEDLDSDAYSHLEDLGYV